MDPPPVDLGSLRSGLLMHGMGDASDAVHNKSAKDALAELRAGIEKMSMAGSVQPQDQANFALSRMAQANPSAGITPQTAPLVSPSISDVRAQVERLLAEGKQRAPSVGGGEQKVGASLSTMLASTAAPSLQTAVGLEATSSAIETVPAPLPQVVPSKPILPEDCNSLAMESRRLRENIPSDESFRGKPMDAFEAALAGANAGGAGGQVLNATEVASRAAQLRYQQFGLPSQKPVAEDSALTSAAALIQSDFNPLGAPPAILPPPSEAESVPNPPSSAALPAVSGHTPEIVPDVASHPTPQQSLSSSGASIPAQPAAPELAPPAPCSVAELTEGDAPSPANAASSPAPTSTVSPPAPTSASSTPKAAMCPVNSLVAAAVCAAVKADAPPGVFEPDAPVSSLLSAAKVVSPAAGDAPRSPPSFSPTSTSGPPAAIGMAAMAASNMSGDERAPAAGLPAGSLVSAAMRATAISDGAETALRKAVEAKRGSAVEEAAVASTDAEHPQASPDIDSVVPGVALNALRTRGLSWLDDPVPGSGSSIKPSAPPSNKDVRAEVERMLAEAKEVNRVQMSTSMPASPLQAAMFPHLNPSAAPLPGASAPATATAPEAGGINAHGFTPETPFVPSQAFLQSINPLTPGELSHPQLPATKNSGSDNLLAAVPGPTVTPNPSNSAHSERPVDLSTPAPDFVAPVAVLATDEADNLGTYNQALLPASTACSAQPAPVAGSAVKAGESFPPRPRQYVSATDPASALAASSVLETQQLRAYALPQSAKDIMSSLAAEPLGSSEQGSGPVACLTKNSVSDIMGALNLPPADLPIAVAVSPSDALESNNQQGGVASSAMTPGLAAAAIASADGKMGAFMARAAGVTDHFEVQKQKEAELRKGYEATQQGLRTISMEERVALTMQKVDLMEEAKRAKSVEPAPPAMDMKERVAMTMSKLAEHQAAQKAMARAQEVKAGVERATSLMHSAERQPFFAAGVREPGQQEAAEVMRDASEFLADTTTTRVTVAQYEGLQSQGVFAAMPPPAPDADTQYVDPGPIAPPPGPPPSEHILMHHNPDPLTPTLGPLPHQSAATDAPPSAPDGLYPRPAEMGERTAAKAINGVTAGPQGPAPGMLPSKQMVQQYEQSILPQQREQMRGIHGAEGFSFSPAPGMLPPQKRTQVSDAVRQAEYFNAPIVGKPLVQAYTMGEGGTPAHMPLVHPGAGVTKQMWALATGITDVVASFPAALPNWVWARVLPCLDLHELVTMASCSKLIAVAVRHEPLWRKLWLGKRCWRQPVWLWEKPSSEVEPKSWYNLYKQRHLLTRNWIKLWEAEERFGHGVHGQAAPLSQALKIAQNGGFVHKVMPMAHVHLSGQRVNTPMDVAWLVQVEWARGCPGVRPTRVTFQQLIDHTEPGETILLQPGVYKSEHPLRLLKPIRILRDPAYGPNVSSHALSKVDVQDFPQVDPAQFLPHVAVGVEKGIMGQPRVVQFGPHASGPAVVQAPSIKSGGGFGHAAWKAGGADGGPNGGGGAGGGLGLLQGLTFLTRTLAFCAHSRMAMEDCEVLGHVACYEGSSPSITYSKLRSFSASDESTPIVKCCRVSLPITETTNPNSTRIAVSFQGHAKGVMAHCAVTMCELDEPAMETDHDAAPTIQENYIQRNAGSGIRCQLRSAPQILKNEFSGNGLIGIVLGGNCGAIVQHNNIHGNRAGGMHVLGDAKPAVSENTLFSNSQVGLLVSGRSRPVFRINRVQGNQGPGIVMNAEAGGSFLGNEVLANFGPGVTISGTSQPTLEGNKVSLNQQAGVMCWGEACPDLSANTIQENGEAGMVIGENVTATIMQNTFHQNKGSGLVFGDHAAGQVHGNSMMHNGCLGMLISGSARPDCRENQVKQNKEGGLNSDDLTILKEFKSLNYVYANGESAGGKQEGECIIA